MKILAPLGLAFLTMMAPFAASQTCIPTFADPATIDVVDLTAAGGGYYYREERDSGGPNSPPIPESGVLTGNGTWIYEESSIPGGLQRGGVGLLGGRYPPGCDATPAGLGDFFWHEGPHLLDHSGNDPSQWTIDPTWINYWYLDPAGGEIGVPCIFINEDPIADETCGAGPDTLVFGHHTAWDPTYYL